MALVRDPLNRGQYVRINDRYDQQDVIVENTLSQKKQIKFLEKTDQLTQNAWNFSPYTRSDSFRDVTIQNPKIVGRLQRQPSLINPRKYYDPIGY